MEYCLLYAINSRVNTIHREVGWLSWNLLQW